MFKMRFINSQRNIYVGNMKKTSTNLPPKQPIVPVFKITKMSSQRTSSCGCSNK